MKKKTTNAVVRGLLCPFSRQLQLVLLLTLLFTQAALSQDSPTAGSVATAPPTALSGFKKGDRLPELIFPGAGPGGSALKLSDLKGKLVIIDFWATWCGACISKIPTMEKLQERFADRLAIIMVTNEKSDYSESFLNRIGNGRLPKLLRTSQDTVLGNIFKHRSLPHYAWIDAAGNYLLETERDELTEANIERVLSGSVAGIRLKNEVITPYTAEFPLFENGNGGPLPRPIYRSVFSGHVPGVGGLYNVGRMADTTVSRLSMTNLAIPRLFGFAYGARKINFDSRRVVLLMKDSSRVRSRGAGPEWFTHNTYCYELIVPKALEHKKFEIAQRDLGNFFPDIAVTKELMWRKCLALVRTSKVDKLKSKGGKRDAKADLFAYDLTNMSIKRFVNEMDMKFLQGQSYAVLDETGYPGPVDLRIRAKLSDLEAVNQELARYDLKFEIRERQIEMLVFRDRETTTPATPLPKGK